MMARSTAKLIMRGDTRGKTSSKSASTLVVLFLLSHITICNSDPRVASRLSADCTELHVTGLPISAAIFQKRLDMGWMSSENRRDTLYMFQMTDGTWFVGKEPVDPSTGRLKSKSGVKAWSNAESKLASPDPSSTIKLPSNFPTSSGWKPWHNASNSSDEQLNVRFDCICYGVTPEECHSREVVSVTMWVVIAMASSLFLVSCTVAVAKRARKVFWPDSSIEASSSASAPSGQDNQGHGMAAAVDSAAAKMSAKERAEETIKAIKSAGLRPLTLLAMRSRQDVSSPYLFALQLTHPLLLPLFYLSCSPSKD
jgi:hypothetical protein